MAQDVLQLARILDKESYDVVEVPHVLARRKSRNNNLWFERACPTIGHIHSANVGIPWEATITLGLQMSPER